MKHRTIIRKAGYDMTGEIKFFRKRFIGGFNRQDVIDYIAELAKERDKNLALKDKAQMEVQALTEMVAKLRFERDEVIRLANEYKSEVLDSARKTLAELEASFETLCAGFEQESTSICTQLETARSIIAILPSALKETGLQFSELKALLDDENNIPYDA